MIRTIAKDLLGKRQDNETVTQYYKRVDRIERKIKKAIFITVCSIGLGIGLVFSFVHGNTNNGYYAADYMDDNGILHDTDGDGDYYHWVQE